MKKLFSLLVGAFMCAAASADTVFPISFNENAEATRTDRSLTHIALQQEGGDVQSYDVDRSKVYVNMTETAVFTVEAGSKVSGNIGYAGLWMHGYFYIDLNNDGQLSCNTNAVSQEGTECVSYSFWSGNLDYEDSGYNSAGVSLSGDNRNTVKNGEIPLPTFTAPSVAGTYNVRFKIDWNSPEPGGSSVQSIVSNGGYVVDAVLVVTASAPAVDPAEEAYNAWYELVMTDMKAVYDAYPEWPIVDVPGQKPASVVYAVCEYYYQNNWLFGFNGFGKDWQLAKNYYAGFGNTIEAKYAEALAIWQAYVDAPLVAEPEPVVPSYVEPVLKAEDVSAEVSYYIYTEARGGLTVVDAAATGIVGTAEGGVGQSVDPTDARQQFVFVNWQDNLYLYNVATQKFLGGKVGGHGEFTDKPVDPILFKNAGNGTVMLYFDDAHNINLGGSKQVTIDGWKQKDGGNSFIIKVAEPFDQTPIIEFLNYHEWNGNIAYTEAPSDIDELLDFDLEFEEARSVEAAPYGVLGAIFDETGDAYAVVLGNRFADEALTADEGKVTVHFTKIADIAAELQPAAQQIAKRALLLGGNTAAKAKVVICGKSFLVDGENVYADVIVKNYELDGTSGAVQTAIETLSTTSDAVIYDLQGRRVSRVQNGVVIANGKKIVK